MTGPSVCRPCRGSGGYYSPNGDWAAPCPACGGSGRKPLPARAAGYPLRERVADAVGSVLLLGTVFWLLVLAGWAEDRWERSLVRGEDTGAMVAAGGEP